MLLGDGDGGTPGGASAGRISFTITVAYDLAGAITLAVAPTPGAPEVTRVISSVVAARDGETPGSRPRTFRLLVWSSSGGELGYDNHVALPGAADCAQVLGPLAEAVQFVHCAVAAQETDRRALLDDLEEQSADLSVQVGRHRQARRARNERAIQGADSADLEPTLNSSLAHGNELLSSIKRQVTEARAELNRWDREHAANAARLVSALLPGGLTAIPTAPAIAMRDYTRLVEGNDLAELIAELGEVAKITQWSDAPNLKPRRGQLAAAHTVARKVLGAAAMLATELASPAVLAEVQYFDHAWLDQFELRLNAAATGLEPPCPADDENLRKLRIGGIRHRIERCLEQKIRAEADLAVLELRGAKPHRLERCRAKIKSLIAEAAGLNELLDTLAAAHRGAIGAEWSGADDIVVTDVGPGSDQATSMPGSTASLVETKLSRRLRDTHLVADRSFSDFVVESLLGGEHHMNAVYACTYMGKQCAVKEILLSGDAAARMVDNECGIRHLLRGHPSIAPIECVFFDKFKAYIVMPRLANNLIGWEQARRRSPWEVQAVFRTVCEAVCYMHARGVLHRDLKPSNILMTADGLPMINDFDLSKETDPMADGATTTIGGGAIGTRGYMAPEVERGERATAKSDIWSFGAMLMKCATGATPSVGVAGVANILPDADNHRLAKILAATLTLDPDARPTAAELLRFEFFTASHAQDFVDQKRVIDSKTKLGFAKLSIDNLVRSRARQYDGFPDHPLSSWSLRRSHIVPDVLRKFGDLPSAQMCAPLYIQFQGEIGIDQGGLTSDMYTTLGLSLCGGTEGDFHFGPHGLPKPDSGNPATSAEYLAIGKALCKSILDGRGCPVLVAPAVLEYLLGGAGSAEKFTLEHLEGATREPESALRYILARASADDTGPLGAWGEWGLSFADFDSADTRDVTDGNKCEFVNMRVRSYLVAERQQNLDALRSGFFCLPGFAAALELFSATDLTLLLCGEQHLTAATVLESIDFEGYVEGSETRIALVQWISTATEAKLRGFLRLCTGRTVMPVGGLRPGGGAGPIKVQQSGADSEALPFAHNCSHELELPDYQDLAILTEKLDLAIANLGSGFQVA